jgi:hypothetical protein
MDIRLNQKQWRNIGKVAGWITTSAFNLQKEFWGNCGIEVPPHIQRHVAAARQDLYFGPLGADYFKEEYGDEESTYSFVNSVAIISDWWNELDIPSYCDVDGYPLSLEEAEEEGTYNYNIDKSSLKTTVFGKELASYIR